MYIEIANIIIYVHNYIYLILCGDVKVSKLVYFTAILFDFTK